ncbi:MAG: 3'-5' exonuclease [Ilumatobacteraceae bacterium]
MLTALGAERPRDVWRRMRFLVDQARAFEDAGQRGLREFVAWAELQGSETARVHEPVLPETDDDSVRIMTVHGAKGLEFAITIVSGLSTGPNNAGRLSVTWHDGVPQVNLPGGNKSEDFDRSADIEVEMDVREKRRLLYVALTRAAITSSSVPTTKSRSRRNPRRTARWSSATSPSTPAAAAASMTSSTRRPQGRRTSRRPPSRSWSTSQRRPIDVRGG